MVSQYELKRLENIKRNQDLLASLNIKSKLAEIASAKRLRKQTKSTPHKKLKPETPTVIRKSLRTQGVVPDSLGLKYRLPKQPKKSYYIAKTPLREIGQIDQLLVNRILTVCKESRGLDVGCNPDNHTAKALIDLDLMNLALQNVAQVLRGRITSLKFFPSPDIRMLVAGNVFGNIAFWNLDSSEKEIENVNDDGIYSYLSHPAQISSILIQPFSMNKIVTSCFGGQIRSLDIEKETFDLLYSSDNAVTSMSQQPDDVKSVYLGEDKGVVRIWDERSERSSCSWKIHDDRINTIDFSSKNTNIMATSSYDGTACIWDLRKLGESKPQSLKLITRGRPVYSAYFSPSGNLVATTSRDNKIGVLSGMNYDDEFIINHNNKTGSYISSFKGVWGWDDSYIFVGNMKKGVDVISTDAKKLVTTLKSPHMSEVPSRFEIHPLKPGMLAGATSRGQVYIWTS